MEDFIDIHLNSKLFFSKRIIKPDYDICFSNLIDDYYYNFAFLKNNNIEFNKSFKAIIHELHSLNRQPVLYVTSNSFTSELKNFLLNNNFQLLYTDSWLVLENADNYISFKSSLDFSTSRVNKAQINEFAKAVMRGFSGENPYDPYENLSDGYITSIENSLVSCNNEYKVIHFAGDKEGKIISTASVVYKGHSGILYNITTNKKYQKLGVCRQMMSDIINELNTLGINRLCVQTEEGYYPELIYKNFGFKKTMLGKAYKMEE